MLHNTNPLGDNGKQFQQHIKIVVIWSDKFMQFSIMLSKYILKFLIYILATEIQYCHQVVSM